MVHLLLYKIWVLEILAILFEHAALVVHGAALGLVFLVDTLLPGEMIGNVTHIDFVGLWIIFIYYNLN